MTFFSSGKAASQSKTIIFAALTAILAALNSLTDTITDPDCLNYIAGAAALIHLVLRFYTKDPIVPPGAAARCVLPFLLVFLVGCVPAAVKEKVILGDERSARAVELLDQGQATLAEIEAYLRSERELWGALRRAVE